LLQMRPRLPMRLPGEKRKNGIIQLLQSMNNQNYKAPIGFASGFVYRIFPQVSNESIEACLNLGCGAFELHTNSSREDMDLAANLNKKELEKFEFTSFHFPKWKDKDEARRILSQTRKLHEIFNFDAITVHADLFMNDHDIFDSMDLPFSIENMDTQKETGRTLEQMKEIMSGNNSAVTIDVNHAMDNDPSFKLAQDLWDEFGPRVSHFHLSGLGEAKGSHLPLFKTGQNRLLDFMKGKNLPIIIESMCENLEEAKKELEFIKNY